MRQAGRRTSGRAALTVCATLVVLGAASGAMAAVNPDKDKLGRVTAFAEAKGPVKRVRVKDYWIRLPHGIPTLAKGYMERDDDYDRHGRLVRREHIHSSGRSSTIMEYVYDTAGNRTVEICRYNDIRPAYVSHNEYDADGHLIETVRVDQTGRVSYRLFCDYDEAGHKLSETRHSRDGMFQSRITFAHSKAGKLVESRSYDADGRITYRTVYEYDDDGRETTMRRTDGQDNVVYTATYAYDEDGAVRRSTSTMASGTTVNVYNEHGDRVAEALYAPDDGELLVRLVRLFAYDEHGNWTLCLELRTSVTVLGRPILVPYYAVVPSIEYYAEDDGE